MSAEKITSIREVAAPRDRCGRCSHPLGTGHEGALCMVQLTDAEGKPKICPCPSGVRTDVFLCQQMSSIQQQNTQIIQGLMSIDRIQAQIKTLIETVSGFEIVELPDEKWAARPKLLVR